MPEEGGVGSTVPTLAAEAQAAQAGSTKPSQAGSYKPSQQNVVEMPTLGRVLWAQKKPPVSPQPPSGSKEESTRSNSWKRWIIG